MDIIAAIKSINAYQGTDATRTWITLGAIRDESEISRTEFDYLIIALAMSGAVHLIPEENQKTITVSMDLNGVTVGGERKHLARLI